jgi:hypothetical protein
LITATAATAAIANTRLEHRILLIYHTQIATILAMTISIVSEHGKSAKLTLIERMEIMELYRAI